jgi:hypothetical protein
MAMTSYEQKMVLVLHLSSLRHSFSDLISECEISRKSSNNILRSIEIAKSKTIAWSSKLVAVKHFAYGSSLVICLHRFIIPYSSPSCQLSLARKYDIYQSYSN